MNFTEEKHDSKRVTMMDIAKIVGCSETTVDRVYNAPDEIAEKTKTKILQVAKELGYERVDRFGHIRPEFLTGKKTKNGTPELNMPLLIALKEQGKSIRQIGRITNIRLPTLLKHFRRYNISTTNPQTILVNGLSKTKRLLIQAAKKKSEIKTRGSDIRKKLLFIINKYKKGVPVETACAELGIRKSAVWNYLSKSTAYLILKKRKARPWANSKGYEEHFKSKKYIRESHMTENAEKYIKNIEIGLIEKEKVIYQTNVGMGRSGFTCDFYASETNTVYELKQRTTTHSNKSLFGQIFIYKTCGHNVAVIFPDDVTITQSLQYALDANHVTVHRLP
jgi:DNA invertase Pin-like site-specific DNA recombinase